MNKQRLVSILKDTNTISKNDIVELKALAKSHPYSQFLHTLIAKGSYKHATKDAQSLLHVAAMYAGDRKVLKSLFSTTAIKVTAADREVNPSPRKSQATTLSTLNNVEAQALRDKVMQDLELLMESKRTYFEVNTIQPTSKKKTTKKATTIKTTKPIKENKASKAIVTKKAPQKSSKKTETLNQIDIIEDFIKKEPSITKKIKENKSSKTSQEDLSESSAQFGDDLISENLAQILTRQGKNDKAIDIYKKLIWKFPQKKAYFATQIEALKK